MPIKGLKIWGPQQHIGLSRLHSKILLTTAPITNNARATQTAIAAKLLQNFHLKINNSQRQQRQLHRHAKQQSVLQVRVERMTEWTPKKSHSMQMWQLSHSDSSLKWFATRTTNVAYTHRRRPYNRFTSTAKWAPILYCEGHHTEWKYRPVIKQRCEKVESISIWTNLHHHDRQDKCHHQSTESQHSQMRQQLPYPSSSVREPPVHAARQNIAPQPQRLQNIAICLPRSHGRTLNK